MLDKGRKTIRSVKQIIDEQVGRWSLKTNPHPDQRLAGPEKHEVANIIAISSTYGALGEPIANLVSQRLSIPLYDRAIAEQVAAVAQVGVATVQRLDETAEGAVEDFIDALLREHNFTQGEYFEDLSQAIAKLWKQGPCVLVGHGAQYLIPIEHRLAVQIVAPTQVRRQRIAQAEDLSYHEARRRVKQKDAQHEAFLWHFFHRHFDAPTSYDLLINTEQMDAADCAAVIVDAYRRRFVRVAASAGA